MKKRINLIIIAFGIAIAFFASCGFPDYSTLPVIASSEAKYVTPTSADIDCKIIDGGGAAVTDRGVYLSITPMPSKDEMKVPYDEWALNFTLYLKDLKANTKYYARAYAANKNGIAFGDQISFTTKGLIYGTVLDYDGNTYNTFEISDFNQVWMQENLKVTHYSNGDLIPIVTDSTEWKNLDTGAYCFFKNNPGYKASYGILYNAYVVADNRHVCPTGWHIPSNEEWEALSNHLGGQNVSGGKLKESGVNHWSNPNTGADNSIGFTALPGTFRHQEGWFTVPEGIHGYWWSSTMSAAKDGAWSFNLRHNSSGLYKLGEFQFKNIGYSIRCIKD